ncbi:MAG: helix-turn-helix domain-containing protein [Microbacterium sp.]|uniref:helix-turn-helix domain-containing protein n=1 Tax=Microbacterium sp. TaxID=51671 RepID=UPI0039E3EF8F
MPESPSSGVRYLDPAQVAELLNLSVDEVVALALERRLRGVKAGTPARWRIEEASIADYLEEQTELTRRHALWEQSNAASFPELWGSGAVRHGD